MSISDELQATSEEYFLTQKAQNTQKFYARIACVCYPGENVPKGSKSGALAFCVFCGFCVRIKKRFCVRLKMIAV